MTIQNATARRIMYQWHGGMSSAFYAAASSGLVASYTALALECDKMQGPDKAKLLSWIIKRQNNKKQMEVVIRGRGYLILPWISRPYSGDTTGVQK